MAPDSPLLDEICDLMGFKPGYRDLAELMSLVAPPEVCIEIGPTTDVGTAYGLTVRHKVNRDRVATFDYYSDRAYRWFIEMLILNQTQGVPEMASDGIPYLPAYIDAKIRNLTGAPVLVFPEDADPLVYAALPQPFALDVAHQFSARLDDEAPILNTHFRNAAAAPKQQPGTFYIVGVETYRWMHWRKDFLTPWGPIYHRERLLGYESLLGHSLK